MPLVKGMLSARLSLHFDYVRLNRVPVQFDSSQIAGSEQFCPATQPDPAEKDNDPPNAWKSRWLRVVNRMRRWRTVEVLIVVGP